MKDRAGVQDESHCIEGRSYMGLIAAVVLRASTPLRNSRWWNGTGGGHSSPHLRRRLYLCLLRQVLLVVLQDARVVHPLVPLLAPLLVVNEVRLLAALLGLEHLRREGG